MSGGAFNYRDCELSDLRDSVASRIGILEYGNQDDPVDPRVIEYMKIICKDLNKLYKVLHSLDWFLSGDTSEEKFINDYENLYKENS